MSIINDKRYEDENFQQRGFILSSFVRMNITLCKDVYEFCDFTISQGWKTPTYDLYKIDKEIKEMYNTYIREVKYG
jgi:hypothetical protein